VTDLLYLLVGVLIGYLIGRFAVEVLIRLEPRKGKK